MPEWVSNGEPHARVADTPCLSCFSTHLHNTATPKPDTSQWICTQDPRSKFLDTFISATSQAVRNADLFKTSDTEHLPCSTGLVGSSLFMIFTMPACCRSSDDPLDTTLRTMSTPAQTCSLEMHFFARQMGRYFSCSTLSWEHTDWRFFPAPPCCTRTEVPDGVGGHHQKTPVDTFPDVATVISRNCICVDIDVQAVTATTPCFHSFYSY